MKSSRTELFRELAAEASACTRCPAMCGRSAVLSELNGSPDARIMFIGEAPGERAQIELACRFPVTIRCELRSLSKLNKTDAPGDFHYERRVV
jgi:hypothetical protein